MKMICGGLHPSCQFWKGQHEYAVCHRPKLISDDTGWADGFFIYDFFAFVQEESCCNRFLYRDQERQHPSGITTQA
jgi:hypothetical protein